MAHHHSRRSVVPQASRLWAIAPNHPGGRPDTWRCGASWCQACASGTPSPVPRSLRTSELINSAVSCARSRVMGVVSAAAWPQRLAATGPPHRARSQGGSTPPEGGTVNKNGLVCNPGPSALLKAGEVVVVGHWGLCLGVDAAPDVGVDFVGGVAGSDHRAALSGQHVAVVVLEFEQAAWPAGSPASAGRAPCRGRCTPARRWARPPWRNSAAEP